MLISVVDHLYLIQGHKIPDATLPGKLSFVECHITSVGPHYGTCFM